MVYGGISQLKPVIAVNMRIYCIILTRSIDEIKHV